MAMAHQPLAAVSGLSVGVAAEEGCDLRLDGLRQQRSRALAQNFGERVGELCWLDQLDDIILGHGVSLLRWRSGGLEHPHDTPPHPSRRHQLPRIAPVVKDGEVLKQVPDDKLYVIDLKATPPKLASTVTVGKQPSGLDINAKGDRALVALRADNAVGVLAIQGTDVKLADTVPVGEVVAHVAFPPDGKRAVAVKFPGHKASILDIALDGKVTYNKLDLHTGQWPYNVAISPDGKIALTADNGFMGASDGSVDTLSVIDLDANPPRIIDRVVVGDGPEGIAFSPKGDVAVAAIIRGSNASKKAYYYNRNGTIDVLKVEGKKVTKIKEIEVGGLPEPVVFTPDGRYLLVGNYNDQDFSILLVGNYNDQDFSILRVEGTDITNTGKRFKVPGHPASARMGP